MKSLPVVVLILFAIFKAHDILVSGEKERSCASVLQDLTKLQLGGITTCTKRLKFKNGKEKSKKMNCILRCVMQDVGLLRKEDGQVVQNEELDAFLTKMFPEYLIDRANRTFSPCLEIGVKSAFRTMEEDPYCSDMDPFIKCLFQQMPNFCS